MPQNHRFAILIALAACVSRDTSRLPAADATFSVRAGAVTGPDSVAAGWTRVRVEEDGGGHRLVIFRLSESHADITTFLAALDTANATPAPALALGGPEVGDIGDVIVQFVPGRYVLGCVRRGDDGHRHASTGEAKTLVVAHTPASAGREIPPAATQDVQVVNFAYVGPERWHAGAHVLRVHRHRDTGRGVARLGPGAVAYLPVELPAGAYVAYCLIMDPASGRAHVEMGMLRAIQVE